LVGGAQAQQAPTPVVVVEPATKRVMVQGSEFIGRVAAIEKVEIRSRVTGFLKKPLFNEGDAVSAGQVLFEIEPESFQATVDQQAALLAGAKADLENADANLARVTELIKTNATSQAQVDQRKAEQARAAANVLQAQAALEQAQINLSYTTIRSPIDGRIGRSTLTPGNLVDQATGTLATVVRDDKVHVFFGVSQREVLNFRKSGQSKDAQKVTLKLADQTIYGERGAIDFLDVTVDQKTDSQTIRATFPNPDRFLQDGQTVRVLIEPEGGAESIVVPAIAVATDQSGNFVLVVNAENKVELRRVKTTTSRDGFTAIAEGLQEGELVIVLGQQRARPGAVVTPQKNATN
jgi:membrane fusion protein (multidrug efflux system)